MARRKKPSGRERKELSRSDFQRASKAINQRNSVIIASEDTESSVVYFRLILNDLMREKKITINSCVFAKHTSTHPTGVLNDLVKHKEKDGSTYNDFDHSWIVIDRDNQWQAGNGHEEEDFNQALSEAEEKGIKVAYSNDAFELWYLLHFNYENAVTPRSDLNSKVKALFNNPKSLKSADFVKRIYPRLVGEPEKTAIRNAEKLLKMHLDNGTEPSNANPSTTIHNLVKLLRSLGSS